MKLRQIYKEIVRRITFKGSADFWENNYIQGGTSGAGSYGLLAQFKADVLNSFVSEMGVRTVVEFGCGDGNQLSLAKYPQYKGYDVSQTAVGICRKRFEQDSSKSFAHTSEYRAEGADLALSLDVIYHLVEDKVFHDYMKRLFASSGRFVGIYSTNHDESYGPGVHVRHRKFTDWIESNETGWKTMQRLENPHHPQNPGDDRASTSPADFYFFEQIEA